MQWLKGILTEKQQTKDITKIFMLVIDKQLCLLFYFNLA